MAFGVTALVFIGNAVRTTATVVAVSPARDWHLAKTKHIEFTLRFTKPDGKTITEQTDQVKLVPTIPTPGDTLQVYYTASDPSDVTDTRYGWPGKYDAEMGGYLLGIAIIGWTVIIVIQRRWKRRCGPRRTADTDPNP